MSELIYGRRAVLDTLQADRRHFFRLWLDGEPDSLPTEGILGEIVAAAQTANLPLRVIRGGIFDKLAKDHVNDQGVALEVGDYPYADINAMLSRARRLEEAPLLLILDHLQDTQNLGTLIRTAEAMGVHGVILPDRRAARITPAVTNSSAGAVERLLVAKVTNINRVLETLKSRDIWIAGLDSEPDTPLLDPTTLDGPLAIVVGSEGSGLSRLTREKCDFLVRLAMVGETESLNAAVAGSIVLYLAQQARSQSQSAA